MIQCFEEFCVETNGQGLYEITDSILKLCTASKIRNGLINLNILHTSASIIIQENADKNVLTDLLYYFKNLAPFIEEYTHMSEGKDDMPEHIRSALTHSHLVQSIKNSHLILGQWQGIFLFEHREKPRKRWLICHIIGRIEAA